MKITQLVGFLLVFPLISAHAEVCPSPTTTDLVPAPWQVFPSSIEPQFEPGISFVQVQIPRQVIAGANGVLCTYKTSLGNYTIYQQILAKPASANLAANFCTNYWFNLGDKGQVCSQSIDDCSFLLLRNAPAS